MAKLRKITLRKIHPDKPADWKKEARQGYFPSFSLKLKDIPEAKGYPVPSIHRFEIEVEITSIREDKVHGSNAGFEIKKVRPLSKSPRKEFAKMIKGDK